MVRELPHQSAGGRRQGCNVAGRSRGDFHAHKPAALDPEALKRLAGTYETATGFKFNVLLKEQDGNLYLVAPGQPEQQLIPYKGLTFRIPEFSDVVFEFVSENGQIKAIKQRSSGGEVVCTRK